MAFIFPPLSRVEDMTTSACLLSPFFAGPLGRTVERGDESLSFLPFLGNKGQANSPPSFSMVHGALGRARMSPFSSSFPPLPKKSALVLAVFSLGGP